MSMLSMVTIAAPSTTPAMLPSPPKMTITKMLIDTVNEKVSGLTKVRLAA